MKYFGMFDIKCGCSLHNLKSNATRLTFEINPFVEDLENQLKIYKTPTKDMCKLRQKCIICLRIQEEQFDSSDATNCFSYVN